MPIVYALHVPNAPNLIAPSVFGGVGADTVRAIEGLRVVARWRPDVLLVATPHWVSERGFRVQQSPRPRQIFDFSGLPPQLSQIRYEPPGDPALARHLVAEGKRRGISVEATVDWGLDHGAWAPLLHVAPGASIPTIPLSISTAAPGSHLAWGEAIRAALDRSPARAVFVSTGSITHSFRRMQPSPSAQWTLGEQIEKEIVGLVLAQRFSDLARYDRERWRTVEPEGDLGPLFMLAGAAGRSLRPGLVSTGQVFGAFGMTVIEFSPPPPEATGPPRKVSSGARPRRPRTVASAGPPGDRRVSSRD